MSNRDVQVRAAIEQDRAAIESVVAAAFNEPAGGRGVSLIRGLDTTKATRASLVAVSDGAVVGHVQLSRSWLDARDRMVEVLVLSPLSVAPDRQRTGIGSLLVEAAILEADRSGAPLLFLEGGWDYYGKRGFESAVPLGFTPPSARIPGPAFQVVRLSSYEKWMKGALVYCEAFWVHDCVGLRHPRLKRVEELAAALARPDSAPEVDGA